ncbi:MAG: nitroreductase family protein [Clostridia bacterium]|nr:nitroreductase family protein [Clostridia bacterium]
MDFLTLSAERYSVRKFKATPVEQEKIDKILKAAQLAPTACNFQPHRILVINNEISLSKLKKCTKWHFDCPLAVLVCYNKDESWTRRYDNTQSGVVDASIVTTHMMLEATELGIGSTWVMSFDPDALISEFEIPGNIEPVALLVMGYPADDARPNAMHTQYKDLSETVSYNEF